MGDRAIEVLMKEVEELIQEYRAKVKTGEVRDTKLKEGEK